MSWMKMFQGIGFPLGEKSGGGASSHGKLMIELKMFEHFTKKLETT